MFKEDLTSAFFLCLFAFWTQNTHAQNSLARGFNDDIKWVSFDDAKKIAKEEDKPILLLIHKSWCGACKALKPQVASSVAIQKLSDDFVMVNVEDEEEPAGKEYAPDGGYIPRILFLNSKADVVPEIYNENGSENYKFYYPTAESLEMGMKRALQYFGKENKKAEDEL